MNPAKLRFPDHRHPLVLLQPGIYNSGPQHWQSHWEREHRNVMRVEQRNWTHPVCGEWVRRLDQCIEACVVPPVLVAHSLGCLAAARWCASSDRPLRGLVLVAVPDPAGPGFPADASGFGEVPPHLGGRPVTLVSSSDDPYSSAAFTRAAVKAWSARHVSLGAAGHINAESGLGAWRQGWDLVLEAAGVAAAST
jgi:predicted alpha/beta hydrolase family esterase